MINPRLGEFAAEMKDFVGWAKGGPPGSERDFTFWDYACCIGTPDLVCGFSELFCPELVLHEGNYFIAHNFSLEGYESFRSKLTSITDIQKVMNHIHISTLLQGQEISDEIAIETAHTIALFWSKLFQDKGLIAEVWGNDFHSAQVGLFKR